MRREFAQSRILRSAKAIKAYFESKLNTKLELLSEPPSYLSDGDIQFSFALSDFGLWGVRAPQALNKDISSEIFDTFQSILGAVEKGEHHQHEFQRIQAALEELPTNVIPLRRRKPLAVADETRDDGKRWVLKLDCLIESPSVEEIHKMALELHSHSRRYAFVEYRHLDADKRMSLHELLSLGAITIFVPDILSLTRDEQESLRLLMATETHQRPLLMVGTRLPFAELRSAPGVLSEFLNALSRAYIKLTRPFSEYKDQGLIHYFLDTLSPDRS